ncbi:MAG: sugar phosphate isomerase/epimerase [Fimbriimonadaceae bacterium]|nr:sugar phosphate isomerase/epimerase [Fimbriimonadaceae bacterium]NUM39345.1 sugar phosphate isomerase/epimerase [Armatimonadota bacterium]HQU18979.1 sugar phosphate isomerase/epimerase [Fimbriimonadaceae bacterium]
MKLSVQLFTLRSSCADDLEGTLEAVRAMGLRYVEFAGLHDHSPLHVRSLLERLGLEPSGCHVSLERLREGLDEVIAESKLLHNRHVVLPWVPADFFGGGWASCAPELNSIGERLASEGLVFCYHNHAFEMEFEGAKPGLDVLFESTSPESLQAQIDCYWVQWGGQDPATYIRDLAGRIPTVHLKDGLMGSEPQDAIAGQGALDWNSILAACAEARVEFGVVEMDHPPGDPLDAVRRCVEFFRSRGVAE